MPRGERRRWSAPVVISMVCALMWPIGSGATPDRVDPGLVEPLRLLIIGDSVTQGSSGDWTWRFRLWKHLDSQGVAVDFVGPRTEMWDYVDGGSVSHDYVDPDFDQDHAARWGLTLAFADTPIDELVETYEPDVVIEMLGTNDLVYLGHSPERVEQDLENFVAAARSADPDVDVVLSEITQTWLSGAPELNALLADGAAALDAPGARVVLADTDRDFTNSDHTFDGSHANAQGEVLIAAAVADALAGLGIGVAPSRPLPTVPLGPRIPPVLSATGIAHGAELEWVRSPGSQESEVWQRDVTAGGEWSIVAEHVAGVELQATDLPAWHLVQFQTRPLKGRLIAEPDAWSNLVEVEVLGDELEAAAAPTMRAWSGGKLKVSWTAVPHATSYTLQWRRAGLSEAWQSTAVPTTSTVVTGLGGRTTYAFRVQATHGDVTGPFSSESTIRVPAWPGDPANVLLLGDSGTIGSTGDWTWRYRLWKHLAAIAPGQVDLVGPRTDLYDRATATYGHQEYVDPAFDRDHAAGWGTGATFPPYPVHELVAGHEVDTVVEMLGLNDLDLLPLTPEQVVDEVRSLVTEARSVNPDVDVVLGEVAQTWISGAPELNVLLHGIAAELDTSQARVVVAETADGFFRRRDTYDDSHPNARGEVKIAAAVADALARTGLGAPAARPLPSVPVGPRFPVVLRGKVREGKVVLRWTSSPGADAYRVLIRRPARNQDWKKAGDTTRRRLTIRGLTPGERVQLVVLPRKGRALAELDVRSNRVSLRP